MKKWFLVVAPICAICVAAVFIFKDRQSPKAVQPVQVSSPTIGVIKEASEEMITLQAEEDQVVTFTNKVRGVSVEHLKEHRDEKEPVSIIWHTDGNQKIATQIDDAP